MMKGLWKRLTEPGDSGFSLLEMVVAMGVLIVLTVGGVLAYNGVTDNARTAAVETAADSVLTAAMAYALDNDPSTHPDDAVTEWEESNSGGVISVDLERWRGDTQLASVSSDDIAIERASAVSVLSAPTTGELSECLLVTAVHTSGQEALKHSGAVCEDALAERGTVVDEEEEGETREYSYDVFWNTYDHEWANETYSYTITNQSGEVVDSGSLTTDEYGWSEGMLSGGWSSTDASSGDSLTLSMTVAGDEFEYVWSESKGNLDVMVDDAEFRHVSGHYVEVGKNAEFGYRSYSALTPWGISNPNWANEPFTYSFRGANGDVLHSGEGTTDEYGSVPYGEVESMSSTWHVEPTKEIGVTDYVRLVLEIDGEEFEHVWSIADGSLTVEHEDETSKVVFGYDYYFEGNPVVDTSTDFLGYFVFPEPVTIDNKASFAGVNQDGEKVGASGGYRYDGGNGLQFWMNADDHADGDTYTITVSLESGESWEVEVSEFADYYDNGLLHYGTWTLNEDGSAERTFF